VRFTFITAKKAEHHVRILCICMRVTRIVLCVDATRAIGAGATRPRFANEAARVPRGRRHGWPPLVEGFEGRRRGFELGRARAVASLESGMISSSRPCWSGPDD
jgi:hypothetical protein